VLNLSGSAPTNLHIDDAGFPLEQWNASRPASHLRRSSQYGPPPGIRAARPRHGRKEEDRRGFTVLMARRQIDHMSWHKVRRSGMRLPDRGRRSGTGNLLANRRLDREGATFVSPVTKVLC
jgi:hypothetical protein